MGAVCLTRSRYDQLAAPIGLNVAQKPEPKPVNEQHKRFIETARELECDEDKERFEKQLGKIATAQQGRKKPKGS